MRFKVMFIKAFYIKVIENLTRSSSSRYTLCLCPFTLNKFVSSSEVISTTAFEKIFLTKNDSDHCERGYPKIDVNANLKVIPFV